MKDRKYDFSSVHVNTDDDFVDNFLSVNKNLIDEKNLFGDGFEDEPHVTIFYGLHSLDPAKKIIDIFEDYPRFELTLGNLSLFKEEKYDVIKVDIECNDLVSLRTLIMNSGEYFSTTYPEYIPHMTVAFVKPDIYDHLDGNPVFNGVKITAKTVTYSCRDGLKRRIELGQNNNGQRVE